MSLYLVIMGIVLCICFSAFCSASEMAYSSCNAMRLESMKNSGSKRAGRAVLITEHFDDALSAILIGNNLANIGASSLASVLVIMLTGTEDYAWLATLILTLLVIIFGETMPKITTKKNPNTVAVRHAGAVRFMMIILRPLIWLVVKLIHLITFKLPVPDQGGPEEAVEELQSIIETAEVEDVLDEDQSELLQAAIDFAEVSAMEVMTARVDVCAIDIDDDWEDIISVIEEAPYSCLPVYEDGMDNIIGVLYLNHFLKALSDGDRVDIRKLLMPPCYVYKTMKLPAVLNQLRHAKQHLAIVTDEYGGTLGVLSMEDVLEQIVGDLDEEPTPEEEEPEIEKIDSLTWKIQGGADLEEVAETLDIELPVEEYDTFGGYIFGNYGTIPDDGSEFEISLPPLHIKVTEIRDHRIKKALVCFEEEL